VRRDFGAYWPTWEEALTLAKDISIDLFEGGNLFESETVDVI